MRAAVFALMLVIAVSGRAAAADNGDNARPFESRPTTIYAVAGLGTPVGLVGAEVEEMILPNWSLSAGVGWGAADAPQGAAMLRWLVGNELAKFTIGAGISGGKYKWWDWASFYGHIIAGNLICDPPATTCGPYYQNDGYNLIYIGVALGYSF